MGVFSSELSAKTMAPLCRQLSTCYNAGIPILRALDLVQNTTRNKTAQDVIIQMGDKIRKGSSLGEAARAHRQHLPPFFVELVTTGERGGRLDALLGDLADYFEDRLEMQRTVMSALAYPVFQLVAAWFLGTWSLGWVSRFSWKARSFSMSSYAHEYMWFQVKALVVFALLGGICVALSRAGVLPWIVGWVKTNVWPISRVTQWFSLARFFRGLSLLLGSGLNVVESIQRSASLAGNPYIERDLLRAIPFLRDGSTLTGAFSACRHLTPTAREMLAVGEESGEIDTMLRKVSEYHLSQARHAVQVAVRAGNVLMIVVVGGLIGFVIIRFYSTYYGGMMNDLGI